jgi:hypothetical protein
MTGTPQPRRRHVAEPRGGLSISPGVIFLAVAVIGSVAYLAYAITVRDASQIPLLASGAVVLGLAFGALAVYCLRAAWRSGQEGRGGRALLIGLVGGGAAMAAAGCVAAALILFQLASGG